jgi:hypothetical protein
MTKKELSILQEARAFIENEFHLENIEIDQADESFTFAIIKKSEEAYIQAKVNFDTEFIIYDEPVRFSGLTDETISESHTETLRKIRMHTYKTLQIFGRFYEPKYTTIPFQKVLHELIERTLNEFNEEK